MGNDARERFANEQSRIRKWMYANVARFIDRCEEIDCTGMVEAWDHETGARHVLTITPKGRDMVLYHVDDDHPQAHGGAFGDGSFIARFRSRAEADRFARGKDYYGKPATVREDRAPRRLAQRWGVA